MENKPAQNIQDSFLNTARKERTSITIYLLSGVKLTGRIRSFDKYSVVLETNNQEQLIFKHAISTVAMGRTSHGHSERPTESRLRQQQPQRARNRCLSRTFPAPGPKVRKGSGPGTSLEQFAIQNLPQQTPVKPRPSA